MTSTASEDITRQAIDAFYRAIEQRSVESLRKVVTPDWEYIPEPPGVALGPARWCRCSPTSLPHFPI
ncbi:MAG: hypothetical protein QOC89_2276 [Paraburkholderia sp.]|jgi:hypothetical protein|uniref:hypothetical protein n=1 Tax=Paraburkholderia sp. TaxID=1926495 RepID=UPI002AFF6283|nr:hypothetical protein [Paraburkholderia sp.]MEA3084579.1 hypothetical protein [Paraburkholderia sp.]